MWCYATSHSRSFVVDNTIEAGTYFEINIRGETAFMNRSQVCSQLLVIKKYESVFATDVFILAIRAVVKTVY